MAGQMKQERAELDLSSAQQGRSGLLLGRAASSEPALRSWRDRPKLWQGKLRGTSGQGEMTAGQRCIRGRHHQIRAGLHMR